MKLNRTNLASRYHYGLFLIGIILSLIGLIDLNWPIFLKEFSILLGQSLVIGSIISYFLDLPTFNSYYQNNFIRALTSTEYLNTLTRPKLIDIRSTCIKAIHRDINTSLDESLIKLDDSITDLLIVPYYLKFRHTIHANFIDNGYIKKRVTIISTLVNPTKMPIKKDISFKTHIFNEGNMVLSDIFKIENFKIGIDDGELIDITDKIQLQEKINHDDLQNGYNSNISLSYNNSGKMEFEFKKILRVERTTVIVVPSKDFSYSKRITDPIKNYRIDYSFNDPNIILKGTMYSTLSSPNNGGNIEIINNNNNISMESHNWLLPGNGLYIIAIPKNEIKVMKSEEEE